MNNKNKEITQKVPKKQEPVQVKAMNECIHPSIGIVNEREGRTEEYESKVCSIAAALPRTENDVDTMTPDYQTIHFLVGWEFNQ